MFSSFRSSSLVLAPTWLLILLTGCAAKPSRDAADPVRSPSSRAYAPPAGATDQFEESDSASPPTQAPAIQRSNAAGYSRSSRSSDAQPRASERSRRDYENPPTSPQASTELQKSRPGLGTTWGENRTSRVRQVDFVRHSARSPLELFRFQYNDEAGLSALFGAREVDSFGSNGARGENRFVTVEIVDASGVPLPGRTAGDCSYVLGSQGDRYAIRIVNHEHSRFEVVATVDGLDVIDGSRGSYNNRGYILNGYDSLLIEGYRRSDSTVAAFRFGSVDESYTAQSGKGDRHVGVIGVALFDERHEEPEYTERELELRDTANPFPARYARPPVGR